jgi:hypothetical protein
MELTVTGFNPGKEDTIVGAVLNEWGFEDSDHISHDDGDILEFRGQDSLYGGESEEQFADRIAITVWKANGKYCKVQVLAVNLEDPPAERHTRLDTDYKKLMPKKAKRKRTKR